LILYNS